MERRVRSLRAAPKGRRALLRIQPKMSELVHETMKEAVRPPQPRAASRAPEAPARHRSKRIVRKEVGAIDGPLIGLKVISL